MRIWLVAVLWMACAARAETLILIQGYQAKGADWRDAGVTEVLAGAGWVDGGRLDSRDGPSNGAAGQRFYTVGLTSDAQLLRQVEEFERQVGRLRRARPDDNLILVGHSAGGVLGRLFMVRNPEAPVSALITFASPHLGTESAELGLALSQSPLGWATRWLGEEYDILGRSQGLYFDLVRERPGTFLYWLNRQPHPQARYISVVRDDRLSLVGDIVVPVWSQDMNQVAVLRGRASSWPSDANHGLEERDGELLLRILRRLYSS